MINISAKRDRADEFEELLIDTAPRDMEDRDAATRRLMGAMFHLIDGIVEDRDVLIVKSVGRRKNDATLESLRSRFEHGEDIQMHQSRPRWRFLPSSRRACVAARFKNSDRLSTIDERPAFVMEVDRWATWSWIYVFDAAEAYTADGLLSHPKVHGSKFLQSSIRHDLTFAAEIYHVNQIAMIYWRREREGLHDCLVNRMTPLGVPFDIECLSD